jgi:hypothetical protein
MGTSAECLARPLTSFEPPRKGEASGLASLRLEEGRSPSACGRRRERDEIRVHDDLGGRLP